MSGFDVEWLLDGLVVGAHLFSIHSAGGLNHINPGLYAKTAGGLTIGAFENSISGTVAAGPDRPRRISVYAGWTFESPTGRFALTAGAMSGYGRPEYFICREVSATGQCTRGETFNSIPTIRPLLVPSVRLPLTPELSMRAGYAYSPVARSAGQPAHVVHFMLEWQR